MNYFSLFGLPESYQIDSEKLAATYQRLAQVTHPDKFASASETDKRVAVQKNAQVNDGYRVLRNALSRAEHLLSIRGIDLQHETKTLQDPQFLMQQMMWREELEEVEDSQDPEAALSALEATLNEQSQKQYATLSDCLAENSDEANHLAADHIRKLKFMEKLGKEIEAKEERLFDV